MRHNSNVPAFLAKLWTLVEDADTDELICWSQEGNSFRVLDEQRFAKEILPKFFKHNNMASFIRQLNMYGFRKVIHIDTGIVKQERDGPVAFQHPYFKHGQDDLLENIKRKVSNARPEDNKIRQEDLTKILASVHSVHSKQENIDARLSTLKRENEALWREISDLRQKHAHQQQLIKKLIHFIVTLVQNNHILNLKRKRPILINSNGKKPKYIHQIYDDKVCVEQPSVNSLNGVKGSEILDDVIICDLTENDAEVMAEITEGSHTDYEEGVELMDYLESIDCSLEDFQSMLYGKQFGIDFDAIEESVPSKENTAQLNRDRTEEENIDKQLIQYTSCPLLAILDGCTPSPELDPGTSGSSSSSSDFAIIHLQPSSSSSASVETDSPSELLDTSLESKQPVRNSFVRLEPLTEAEASKDTLFYLCELSPVGLEVDSTQLERV
ncbi:heat shock factor protein 2 isoform X4 [Pleuronectes platessa]|uniref:heat shock factor protein 2 isoform X4 n=1 Tax=Pleuronectes platessa TaxID=8262 RepID=UPI00232A60F3|nr:heat shock factor protein 2 isoform X4 [Pleuronectes platessa]